MNKNIIATILIIVGIGLYFTVAKPIFDETKSVKEVNDKLQEALTGMDEVIRIRDDINKKYNSIGEENKAKLDKMIPDSVDNIRLVIDLNNLARQKNLMLENLRVAVPSGSGKQTNARTPVTSVGTTPVNMTGAVGLSGPNEFNVAEPTLDKITFSFGVKATFDQFVGLLQAMQANLRITDLTSLSMTANDQGVYEFDLQFQTYWLKQ